MKREIVSDRDVKVYQKRMITTFIGMINYPEPWLITEKDKFIREDSPPYLDFL